MGGLTSRSATPQVPQDLAGMRGSNIQLLQYLLGFPGGQGGANVFSGVRAAQGGGTNPMLGGDPTSRLQSFFGQLGVPQNDLQRQAGTGINQFLNQPAPQREP